MERKGAFRLVSPPTADRSAIAVAPSAASRATFVLSRAVMRPVAGGFPPTMIQVGSSGMLLDDSRHFASRLRAAGGAVDLRVVRGQIHVFPAMFRALPEARTAIRQRGTFLADHLGSPAAGPPSAVTA